jgi:hypothetical protein
LNMPMFDVNQTKVVRPAWTAGLYENYLIAVIGERDRRQYLPG